MLGSECSQSLTVQPCDVSEGIIHDAGYLFPAFPIDVSQRQDLSVLSIVQLSDLINTFVDLTLVPEPGLDILCRLCVYPFEHYLHLVCRRDLDTILVIHDSLQAGCISV